MGLVSVFKDLGDIFTFGAYSEVVDSFTGEKQRQAVQNTNDINLQIARETNQMNYDLWKEQLAYNDPTAQMERLKNAGLNPQLALGSLQNVTGSPPTMQGATMQPPPAKQYSIEKLFNLMMQGANLKKATAEANLAQYQADSALTRSELDRMVFDEYFYNPDYMQRKIAGNIRKVELDNDLIDQQITRHIIQRDLDTETMKKLIAETQNILKQGTSIDYDNKVKKYRADLAEQGFNPDSTGMDYLIDALIKNPAQVIKNLKKAIFDDVPDAILDFGAAGLGKIQKHEPRLYNQFRKNK